MKLGHLCIALAVICLACSPALAQWCTYQAGPGHDGFVPVSLNTSQLTFQWSRSLATRALNPVAAANAEVFVSVNGILDADMNLYALDAATGNTKWYKNYDYLVHSVNPPAYANGRVYIQTNRHYTDSWVWAYDANSGNQIFKSQYAAQYEDHYAPTIYDGTVYVNGGYFGGMYAYDGVSGQCKWFYEVNQYDQWTPTVDANYVYAYTGDYSPALTVVDRHTGQLVYEIEDPDFDWGGWSMYQSVALGTQNDAFSINGDRLICWDLANRNIKWQSTRSFGYAGQVTVAQGVVYAVDGGGLTALNEATGSFMWSWTPPTGALVDPVIVTRTHALASTASTTYAISLTSHTSGWSYPLGGKLALSNRALYIAGDNGTLVSIGIPKTAIIPSTPSYLSATITSPANAASCNYAGNTISVSGGANELGMTGSIVYTGQLASLNWSNNRGGSGSGYFDSYWRSPTTWSTSDITLQPGDNLISITAVDLWGKTGTDSITITTPASLAMAITSPTTQSGHFATTTSVSLSGTANAVLASGTPLPNAALTSVTWSSSRGSSGVGTFSSASTSPTTWSIAGIPLQAGDNVITVTATDVWGHSAQSAINVQTPNGIVLQITGALSGMSADTYSSPASLSGTAASIGPGGVLLDRAYLSKIMWSEHHGASFTGPTVSPTTWLATGIPLLGGPNLVTLTATDIWGSTAQAAITVNWLPSPVGAARQKPVYARVNISDAVVTATSVVSGSIFVEAADRSSGIRVYATQGFNLGDRLSFVGTVYRPNGEYAIDVPQFNSVTPGEPLKPIGLTISGLANDRLENLHYVGLNTTGMLVRTQGMVTGAVDSRIFYIDDGSGYRDGAGSLSGIRVHVPSGAAVPQTDQRVLVTGISRPESTVLTNGGTVNGIWYPPGSIVYLPSIWTRGDGDIRVL